MVYSGLYPTDSDDFEDLRDALEKFRLNDSALVYQPETSAALGFGFDADFLDCFTWKLFRKDYCVNMVNQLLQHFQTLSIYVYTKKGEKIIVDNPAEMPCCWKY